MNLLGNVVPTASGPFFFLLFVTRHQSSPINSPPSCTVTGLSNVFDPLPLSPRRILIAAAARFHATAFCLEFAALQLAIRHVASLCSPMGNDPPGGMNGTDLPSNWKRQVKSSQLKRNVFMDGGAAASLAKSKVKRLGRRSGIGGKLMKHRERVRGRRGARIGPVPAGGVG